MSSEPPSPEESPPELVEVVDVDGTVSDIVTRQAMRELGLRHRCTYVVVTTPDRQLIVHRRAEWKDVFPGYWDLAFGGVCGVGERWDSSAQRELAEEAGLEGLQLHDLGPVLYEDGPNKLIGRVYHTVTDQPVTCPDGEVVEVARIDLDDLDLWLRDRLVCPDTAAVVAPLVRNIL